MLRTVRHLADAGVDAMAVKPTERDPKEGYIDAVVIDYEGYSHLPDEGMLRRLARQRSVRLTVPIRADGFDPLGDDARFDAIPDSVDVAFVAGNPAYLSPRECRRAVGPRLRAVLEPYPDAWVGTEGIQRLALATGAPQYELLSGATAGSVRSLRALGVDVPIAVYAPTVITDDRTGARDALAPYLQRRKPVADALDDNAVNADDLLMEAMDEYALVGSVDHVATRVARLREAGVTTVVGYPVPV